MSLKLSILVPSILILVICAVFLSCNGAGATDQRQFHPRAVALQAARGGPAGAPLYFHMALGPGPILITDGKGALVEERRDDPFGAPLDRLDAAAIDVHGTLNKPIDRYTELGFHGARWYSARRAGWLTPDPPLKAAKPVHAGSPAGLHPYQYVEHNPLLFWDPDGRELRVTGERRSDVLAYLSRASGLKLRANRHGKVRIVGRRKGGSAAGAKILRRIIKDKKNHVSLETHSNDVLLLVGRPKQMAEPGTYEIDVSDIDALDSLHTGLGPAATMHEAYEAHLHARARGNQATHLDRHSRAIDLENEVLDQLGINAWRTREYNQNNGRNRVFIVDYDAFEVRFPYNSYGHGAPTKH